MPTAPTVWWYSRPGTTHSSFTIMGAASGRCQLELEPSLEGARCGQVPPDEHTILVEPRTDDRGDVFAATGIGGAPQASCGCETSHISLNASSVWTWKALPVRKSVWTSDAKPSDMTWPKYQPSYARLVRAEARRQPVMRGAEPGLHP